MQPVENPETVIITANETVYEPIEIIKRRDGYVRFTVGPDQVPVEADPVREHARGQIEGRVEHEQDDGGWQGVSFDEAVESLWEYQQFEIELSRDEIVMVVTADDEQWEG